MLHGQHQRPEQHPDCPAESVTTGDQSRQRRRQPVISSDEKPAGDRRHQGLVTETPELCHVGIETAAEGSGRDEAVVATEERAIVVLVAAGSDAEDLLRAAAIAIGIAVVMMGKTRVGLMAV